MAEFSQKWGKGLEKVATPGHPCPAFMGVTPRVLGFYTFVTEIIVIAQFCRQFFLGARSKSQKIQGSTAG